MTGPDPDPVVDWDEFEQATALLPADPALVQSAVQIAARTAPSW